MISLSQKRALEKDKLQGGKRSNPGRHGSDSPSRGLVGDRIYFSSVLGYQQAGRPHGKAAELVGGEVLGI